jgi:iron complex transport system substrate-binding protein
VTRRDALNAAWLGAVLAATTLLAGALSRAPQPKAARALDRIGTPQASAGTLTDATGHAVPLRAYTRIASASLLADGLLLELAEPERIVALSQGGKLNSLTPERYGQRTLLEGPGDLERLMQTRAQLLLVNQPQAQAAVSRARSLGIEVFDLGAMRGMQSLGPNIRDTARLLGDPARGERLWRSFQRQMAAVAGIDPGQRRLRGLYVAVYGGTLLGGTRGTSYHDVLEAAGLVDVAAHSYEGWPQYDPEQLITLDPAILVTNAGSGDALCDLAWARRLQACRDRTRALVELPAGLVGDPGLGMLDAAEALHEAVYRER